MSSAANPHANNGDVYEYRPTTEEVAAMRKCSEMAQANAFYGALAGAASIFAVQNLRPILMRGAAAGPIPNRIYIMTAAFGLFYGAGWNKDKCLKSISALPPSPLTSRLVYQMTGKEQVTDGLSDQAPIRQRQAHQEDDHHSHVDHHEHDVHSDEHNRPVVDEPRADIPSRLRTHRTHQISDMYKEDTTTVDNHQTYGGRGRGRGARESHNPTHDSTHDTYANYESDRNWNVDNVDASPSSYRDDPFRRHDDADHVAPLTFEQRRATHRDKVRAERRTEREEALRRRQVATEHMQQETETFSGVRRGASADDYDGGHSGWRQHR